MPAYLKAVDKCSGDYTFCQFETQYNGVSRPISGSQQLATEIIVSLEAFYAN